MNKKTQEALKMAIGKLVLEKMTSGNDVPVSRCTITNVEIHALSKEALEQPAQEAVAYMYKEFPQSVLILYPPQEIPKNAIPLYTNPHQWQGLTDDEIDNVADTIDNIEYACEYINVIDFARAIEQALKEKNT
jgi:hypothetical protein